MLVMNKFQVMQGKSCVISIHVSIGKRKRGRELKSDDFYKTGVSEQSLTPAYFIIEYY
jgi:hypothetical protein